MFIIRFLLVTRHRSLATPLIVLLLLWGCGADEAINNPVGGTTRENENPHESVPISTKYYPMTVGSRWVYRNADGSEWTREVTNADFLNAHQFAHSFSYNPPPEESQLNFFQGFLVYSNPGSDCPSD